MKGRMKIRIGVIGVAALVPAFCVQAQAVSNRVAPPAFSPQVLREIDDPSNGNRWLLVRDGSPPGGPGRLLLASSSASVRLAAAPRKRPSAQSPPLSAPAFAAPTLAAPVIHPGDALIVEETTPLVEARLTATALGVAPVGALFTARLEIGGKVVRVRALSPGRASLDPGPARETEVEP